jgi:hypothetical protein
MLNLQATFDLSVAARWYGPRVQREVLPRSTA